MNIQLFNTKIIENEINLQISLKNWIIDMPYINNFDFIYISIGGKYFKKNYPLNLNTGLNQLIPSFLKDENVLIIVIDKFNNEELETNINYIKFQINNNYQLIPINYNIIIINNYLTQILANYLIKFLNDFNIKQKLMICNYVYYLNGIPNKIEENNIIQIENILKYIVNYNDKQFKDNVFNWLGNYNPKYLCSYYFTLQVKLFLKIPFNLLNSQQKKFIKSNIINFVDFL